VCKYFLQVVKYPAEVLLQIQTRKNFYPEIKTAGSAEFCLPFPAAWVIGSYLLF
jgi:hypothetical protein